MRTISVYIALVLLQLLWRRGWVPETPANPPLIPPILMLDGNDGVANVVYAGIVAVVIACML